MQQTIPAAKNRIRLLVVDDHPVICEGLRSIVLHSPQIEVVGMCSTGLAALRFAIHRPVDVMLIGLGIHPMDGLELLRQLNRNSVSCRALVLANSELDEELGESIRAGAVGYLCKNMSPARIIEGILAAAQGKKVYSSEFSPLSESRHIKTSLTARQAEVLHLVSKGLSNKEVGDVLGLSHLTVRNQMKRICTKLDASDRTEASTTALERRLIRR